ncbi:MAG: hypothetical protein IKP28_06105 [Clostridia bacterium]|nr:hypothetical protein [Clostridia bacterium]
MKVTVEILRFSTEVQSEIASKMESVEELKRLAAVADEKVLYGIIRNENATADILDVIARRDFVMTQGLVATDERTSVETLEMLAESKNPNLRLVMACSKMTPEHILRKFLEDEDYAVREVARITLNDR